MDRLKSRLLWNHIISKLNVIEPHIYRYSCDGYIVEMFLSCQLKLFKFLTTWGSHLPLGYEGCSLSSRETHSPATISVLGIYHRHCHLCHTRYSFTSKWSEQLGGEVPGPIRTQRRNNDVTALRGRSKIFPWKSCTKRALSKQTKQESGFRPLLCTNRLNWARRTPWGWWDEIRWHCPPDTGFEIQTLEVWGRARYLSVTEFH